MSYEVVMRPSAARDFDRAPERTRARLAPVLRALADDPRPPGVKALKGRLRGMYRVRVGRWRIVYRVDEEAGVVSVAQIALRDSVYERAARGRGEA